MGPIEQGWGMPTLKSMTSMVERTKGIKRPMRVGQWGKEEETEDKYGPSVMLTLANQHSIMALVWRPSLLIKNMEVGERGAP